MIILLDAVLMVCFTYHERKRFVRSLQTNLEVEVRQSEAKVFLHIIVEIFIVIEWLHQAKHFCRPNVREFVLDRAIIQQQLLLQVLRKRIFWLLSFIRNGLNLLSHSFGHFLHIDYQHILTRVTHLHYLACYAYLIAHT